MTSGKRRLLLPFQASFSARSEAIKQRLEIGVVFSRNYVLLLRLGCMLNFFNL